MCRCYNGEARSGSPHLRGQCSSHYEVYHHTLTYNTNLLNFNHLSSSLLLKLLKKSQGAITSAGFSFFLSWAYLKTGWWFTSTNILPRCKICTWLGERIVTSWPSIFTCPTLETPMSIIGWVLPWSHLQSGVTHNLAIYTPVSVPIVYIENSATNTRMKLWILQHTACILQ